MWLALSFASAVLVIFTRLQYGVAQDTLGFSNGFISFNATDLNLQLVNDSQTVYSISPTGSSFNFIPGDVMANRSMNGNYHLGDITFRVREANTKDSWISGDSAQARQKVTALKPSGNQLAISNLSATLPSNSLISVTRRWELTDEGYLELLFDVLNSHDTAVEIGSLGAPVEFNNIFTNRDTADTNEKCSFFDPYIGLDAGFVQVTPLLGTLPPLVVFPASSGGQFEGWRFLPEAYEDPLYYQSQTFEGLFEWQFHTLAYAENEWADVDPWNEPTSVILQPAESKTYGLQFRVGESIPTIENTLMTAGRPVAVGIPGYIVPADINAKLFLNYSSAVSNISSSPAGALSFTSNSEAQTDGWIGYTITGVSWGRSRLEITYEDGTVQTVHYYVTHDAVQVVADLGNFLTTDSWFDNASDPFDRAPSVITYDREVNAQVKDDARAWVAGLSDEGGTTWLAAMMKQYVQPSAVEVAKLEMFVDQTLWGTIQNANATVKKAVYFYEPDLVDYEYPSTIDYTQWWSWTQAESFATDRAYDYVHVTAGYWAIYRVARNYPDLVTETWDWFLLKAYNTVIALNPNTVGYVDDGLMGETVFGLLLEDLKREGYASQATKFEAAMKARWEVWAASRYPFGSEMAWDSTGQEGVYYWSTYFNDSTTATNVVNSVIAYQPLIPHWGYNGNARRYWDFVYAGKLERIERQIHHYGSPLNAIPLMSAFEASPDNLYLLRVAFGGLSGPMSNIDEGGFAAAAFHSWEDTLMWDGYSGDYGQSFSGHSMKMGAVIINHPDFGWQAFGGNVIHSSANAVSVNIRDSVRRRIFIAPIAALLTLDAGAFDSVTYSSSGTVQVTILPAPSGVSRAASAPTARLLISQAADVSSGILSPTKSYTIDAGAYVVPFSNGVVVVELS